MRLQKSIRQIVDLCGIILFISASLHAQEKKLPSTNATPVMDILGKFTAADVPKGEVVWQFGPKDLPPGITFTGTQTRTRLANGNTIICSTGGRGKGAQLIEVTPEKKVVWVLYDWENLGPATAVQVLDDPGIPEKPGDLQR